MYDLDFKPETPTPLSRREFMLAASLATGYAASVQPIAEGAIITPPIGLEAGDAKVTVGKESLPIYFVKPTEEKDLPIIVVVQEIFGLHEYIKDVCRRFAKEGYLAVAPDLFFRYGDATKIIDRDKLRSEIVDKVDDVKVETDIDALIDWAKGKGGNTARAGVTGFCWGGRQTWLYAAQNPRLKAGVAWYGQLANKKDPLRTKTPTELASALTVPVLGLYAGDDQNISLESVDAMRKELAKGKSGSEIVVFPKVPHGFHADYRPSYRKEEAEKAWAQCLAWFKTRL